VQQFSWLLLPPRLLWEIRVSDSMEVDLQAAEEASEMMVVLVEGASMTILEALGLETA